MSLRTLVIDDEPVSARRLSALLRTMPGVESADMVQESADALERIRMTAPDVVFLDIEMPGLSGLQLAERLDSKNPPVIVFVTAFSQYAVDAFGLAAADYLLKPVDPHRLSEALDRAREQIAAQGARDRIEELHAILGQLRAREAQRAVAESLWVRERGVMRRIQMESIIWVQAERDYVRIHTLQRRYLIRGALGDLENKLPADRFLRVRRSALIRVDCIETVERRGDRDHVVVLSTGEKIRIGRSYLGTVRALLERF